MRLTFKKNISGHLLFYFKFSSPFPCSLEYDIITLFSSACESALSIQVLCEEHRGVHRRGCSYLALRAREGLIDGQRAEERV